MPIRPENKARYPKDWPAISRRIRFERANNQCEFCGVQNYELGGRTKDGQWHKARITGCDRKLPEPGSHWWCDGEVSEPLVGRQGSRVSMRVARGSASLLSSHGRGTWPRDVLKKVSRGLSRVEAGNPGFPRLVQVTSGGFSWWL